MPIAQIHIVEGRTPDQKQQLIRAVTEAIQQSLGAPLESIRVLLYDVPKENWGVAGVSKAESSEAKTEV